MSDEHDTLQVTAGGATIAIDAEAKTVEVRDGRFRWVLSLDEALLLSMKRFHGPWRTRIARTLTALGDGRSWAIAGFASMATLTARGLHVGLRIGAATTLGSLTAYVLKRSLTRARPDVSIAGFEALVRNPDEFSFPSGHTAAAMGAAVALAGEPYGIGPASLLLAVGIALSRVYLGAHYPLDVGAGALIGVLAGVASRLLVP